MWAFAVAVQNRTLSLAEAEIEIDCRVKTAAEGDRVRQGDQQKIRTTVPGTTRKSSNVTARCRWRRRRRTWRSFEKAKICGEKVGL